MSVGDDLTDATVDRAVVAVYTQPGEPNDLLTQAVAQRRLTVALGGFMDAQPFNGETDAEPVDATVAAARDALAAWAQRGVSIIKTDFIVHQSAPAVFKGMDGALAVPAEDIPPVLFGSSAVVQCNEGTLPEEFRSGPCCVPPKVPIEDPGLTGDYPALHAEACSVRVSAVVLTALVLMVVVLGF